MSDSLNNKTAIVTGASRGIGKAIALSLAKAGVKVVLAARHQDDLEVAKKEILKNGGQCIAVQTNVAEEAHIEQLHSVPLTFW
jgi:3-oxoacyl-[acyl-carrier protein] reductase